MSNDSERPNIDKTQDAKATQSASVKQDTSWADTFIGVPLIILLLVAAGFGVYFIVTKWGSSSTELHRDGTVEVTETRKWGTRGTDGYLPLRCRTPVLAAEYGWGRNVCRCRARSASFRL